MTRREQRIEHRVMEHRLQPVKNSIARLKPGLHARLKPGLHAISILFACTLLAQSPIKIDSDTISGLGARNIGSATMSGRIAAIDGVWEKDRLTVYIGAASGGVWKSVNGGTTYKPIFDKQGVQSIGAIAVDSKNPKTIWVGTGEAWTRNSVSMDKSEPKTLYAGRWEFRRKGWTVRSGGDGPDAPRGSGLFKSNDGGATWTELDAKSASGLPAKPWGRVAVTVAQSKPNVVYAFVEAVPPANALYRSDDGGKTWSMRDRSQYMIWRPFYFANLLVDPKDENKLYKPDLTLIVSNDGGKSFSNAGGGAHGDFHDVWID